MALLGLYLIACALLMAAGLAKSVRPYDTARALRSTFSGPSVDTTAAIVRILAVLELGLGAAAIVRPVAATASAVAGSYLAFSVFLLIARARGGPLATCGCFGEPDTPPTAVHVVVDLGLAASAAAFAVSAHGSVVHDLGNQYGAGAPLLAACLLCSWMVHLVVSPLARLSELRATVFEGRNRR